MKRKIMAVAGHCIAVWIFVVAIADVYAEEITVQSTGTFSGSFVSTVSDTNFDGIKAGLFTGGGQDSEGGPFTTQSVTEHFVTGEKNCPNGNPGIEFSLVPGTGAFVNRYASGDLVYGVYMAHTQCFDTTTKTLFYNYRTKATGGTGRFAGATGTSEGQGQGNSTVLLHDAAGNAFGAAAGQYSGTLIIPGDD